MVGVQRPGIDPAEQVEAFEHGLELPATRFAVHGWTTHWKRPSYRSVLSILGNPTYAGAYAYGKTTARPQVREGAFHSVRVRKPLEQWSVLLRDRHDGYITWEEYDRNQKVIAGNANMKGAMVRGSVRNGSGLLVGLLRCGHCGRKLKVHSQ